MSGKVLINLHENRRLLFVLSGDSFIVYYSICVVDSTVCGFYVLGPCFVVWFIYLFIYTVFSYNSHSTK